MVAILSDPLDAPMLEPGRWLHEQRRALDGAEAGWLAVLADFDVARAWADDGQLSCTDWLRWRCQMARSTAFEKVRVAHALRRRPKLMSLLAAGELSYSAIRTITRIDDPSPEVEEALIRLGKEGPVWALERAVRYYERLADQERGPEDLLRRFDRRGVRISRGLNGKGSAEIVLNQVELDELATALEAFMAHPTTPVEESSRVDSTPAPVAAAAETTSSTAGEPVEESSRVDSPARPAPPESLVPWWQKRADAFMDLVRTAKAHVGDLQAVGADRYLVHLVYDVNRADATGGGGSGQRLDRTPLDPGLLAQVMCDASTVTQVVDGSEPLQLGRKARMWNTAQRRAIFVRDGGHCRMIGCDRIYCDIHHLRPWEAGGSTDISNGAPFCTAHHALFHGKGFTVTGDANGVLTFFRPDGTVIGTTRPEPRRPALF